MSFQNPQDIASSLENKNIYKIYSSLMIQIVYAQK